MFREHYSLERNDKYRSRMKRNYRNLAGALLIGGAIVFGGIGIKQCSEKYKLKMPHDSVECNIDKENSNKLEYNLRWEK